MSNSNYKSKVEKWLNKSCSNKRPASKQKSNDDPTRYVKTLKIQEICYLNKDSDSDSLQSIDTATYILSNRKQQKMNRMSVKEFSLKANGRDTDYTRKFNQPNHLKRKHYDDSVGPSRILRRKKKNQRNKSNSSTSSSEFSEQQFRPKQRSIRYRKDIIDHGSRSKLVDDSIQSTVILYAPNNNASKGKVDVAEGQVTIARGNVQKMIGRKLTKLLFDGQQQKKFVSCGINSELVYIPPDPIEPIDSDTDILDISPNTNGRLEEYLFP